VAVEAVSVPTGFAGRALKRRFERAERRGRWHALALVAPLVTFLAVMFVLPIGYMLFYSISSPNVRDGLPDFYASLLQDEAPVPGEAVFRALAADAARAQKERLLGRALKPFRQQDRGVWRLFNRTAKKLPEAEVASMKGWFLDFKGDWGKPETWAVVRRVSQPYTPYYFINSLDLARQPDGSIASKPERERVYLYVLRNTFAISFWVTVFTLVLGYPVAYILANMKEGHANLALVLVLFPFWTSLLVRTYAWIIILQTQGPVNQVLTGLELVPEPVRLVHNRFGVYVAMTHILLPFMLLPIYSVMKGISPMYMKAAANLGANPLQAFVRVYLPQTLPGVGAGSLLVFILALGYYITPALVGGPRDTMISMMIANNVNWVLNWGMAAALGTILLLATLVVFLLYNRFLGLETVRLS
jgi:putative spermidine/putrescine transport system permease protein